MMNMINIMSVLLLTTLGLGLAKAGDPWGEHISPRLRVNYLSQKSGKPKFHSNFAVALFVWHRQRFH